MTDTNTNDGNQGSTTAEAVSLEEHNRVLANFQDAVAERDKTKAKLRKLEETAATAVELQKNYDALFTEKSNLQQQFETLQTEWTNHKTSERNKFIDTSLTAALEAAGAVSIPTAIKLIDKSKIAFEGDNLLNDSVISLIEDLRKSDPILFGPTDPKSSEEQAPVPGSTLSAPPVKHAGTGDVSGAFEKELKLCKNNQQIQEVLRKYNKIQ